MLQAQSQWPEKINYLVSSSRTDEPDLRWYHETKGGRVQRRQKKDQRRRVVATRSKRTGSASVLRNQRWPHTEELEKGLEKVDWNDSRAEKLDSETKRGAPMDDQKTEGQRFASRSVRRKSVRSRRRSVQCQPDLLVHGTAAGSRPVLRAEEGQIWPEKTNQAWWSPVVQNQIRSFCGHFSTRFHQIHARSEHPHGNVMISYESRSRRGGQRQHMRLTYSGITSIEGQAGSEAVTPSGVGVRLDLDRWIPTQPILLF